MTVLARTNINHADLPVLITHHSSPLTLISLRQPRIRSTVRQGINRTRLVRFLDRHVCRGCFAREPAIATGCIIKDGETVPTPQSGVGGTEIARILVDDPVRCMVLWCPFRCDRTRVRNVVEQDADQEGTEVRVLIASFGRSWGCNWRGSSRCDVDWWLGGCCRTSVR